MLKFFLKLTPDSHPLDLDQYIPKNGYSRSVEIAAEDRLNNFRGSQIQLTLSDKNSQFSSGEFNLQGGEEVALCRPATAQDTDLYSFGYKAIWSGTIDPTLIERTPDNTKLKLRVLQNGSLLNTVFAGLPDWSLDTNGELVTDNSRMYRYKGTADQWTRQYNPDGTPKNNRLETENTEVFYTPSAKDALEDELYRSKFAERIYHFHTFSREIDGVEWPFPQVTDSGYDNAPGEKFIGQFRPHLRPDFSKPPAEWEEFGGVTRDNGAYLRTQNPVLNFRRQPVTTIIQSLVQQFNQTAKFPLQFDPATDAVIIPPSIAQQIEILKRQPDVEWIDLQYYPATTFIQERFLVLVNWKDDQLILDPEWTIGKTRFSLFAVENETELTPLAENVSIDNLNSNYCWPEFGRNFRFARVSTVTNGTFGAIYTMRYSREPGPRDHTFHVVVGIIRLSNLTLNALRTTSIVEEAGDFTDGQMPVGPPFIVNRSASIDSNGDADVRQGGAPYLPLPPEVNPQFSLTVNGRSYGSRDGGLTVSGALFDRVAVDAENTRISSLLSELAKLTHSRWFVTPDRRLKFLSRQYYGTQHNLKTSRSLKTLTTFSRKYDEEDLPTIGSGLVLPENFKQAHKNWVEDNVLGNESLGFEVPFKLREFNTLPQISDSLNFPDPALPAVPDSARASKYGGNYQLEKAVLDIDNEVLTLTAVLPTL